jgi:hypothetical protein
MLREREKFSRYSQPLLGVLSGIATRMIVEVTANERRVAEMTNQEVLQRAIYIES